MLVASLLMYDQPDVVQRANDALWAALRDRLRARGLDVPDALDRTVKAIELAREAGISLQINTTLTRSNLHEFAAFRAKNPFANPITDDVEPPLDMAAH